MDNSEAELAKSLAEPPDYTPPNLIDAELAEQIATRGARLAKENMLRIGVWFIVGMAIGAVVPQTLLAPNVFLSILFIILLLAWLIGAIQTRAVTQAYRQRQYDLAFKLLDKAIRWNALWHPFTGIQLRWCQSVELNMLILEGRSIEFELITRYLWAVSEHRPITSGVPKSWAITNNLAVSWMLQSKPLEAAEMFAAGLKMKLSRVFRGTLLNNLALCQIRAKQVDAAERTLTEAFALLGSNTASYAGARLKFIRALTQLERGNLNAAATSLEEALSPPNNTKEFQAQCMAALARVRQKQGRLDESELHFRNAIDILATADNPNYISLAENLHYYAQLLLELGKTEAAQRSLDRARRYFDYYMDRETLAVNNFKARLKNPKRIRSTCELLTLTRREPLFEARD